MINPDFRIVRISEISSPALRSSSHHIPDKKKETHHLELINSHEGNKWCALYISAKVEFY